jgi:hypothetical protein
MARAEAVVGGRRNERRPKRVVESERTGSTGGFAGIRKEEGAWGGGIPRSRQKERQTQIERAERERGGQR